MVQYQTVLTTCTRDCPNTCGLVATVKAGRLVSLSGSRQHPLTAGISCHKTRRYIERVYSSERVTRPMVRQNGRWETVSWSDVLDLVAEKILSIAAESGTEAILHYQGYGERTALKLLNRYFFNLAGGVTTVRGSLCGGTGQAAQDMDFGKRISHDPLDHLNSRSMVLWARNPATTNISLVPIIQRIQKRGGKIIVIDSVKTRSVSLADHHIAPKPGSDGYLAMATAKIVLHSGAGDTAFLRRYCDGFEQYRALLEQHSVTELCSLAGVSVQDAKLLADTLMEQKTTSILLGWGLHRYAYAHEMIRPIDALAAICGNIGIPGGGVSQGFDEYGPYDEQYWGDALNPPRRRFPVSSIGDAILQATEPPIRMIFVTAANPLCMAPNSRTVAKAFQTAEFVVYSGHFLDDTADCADVFLPATTFLEEIDVAASYGHNYVGPVNPVIAPIGECRSEFRMFHDLAGRFPFANHFQCSEETWLERICSPIWEQGHSLASLKRGAVRLDAPMVPYRDRRFSTPTGKFQFMTAYDGGRTAVREEKDCPYRLLTVAAQNTICSERTLTEHAPRPEVRIHSEEAAANGLCDGSIALLKNACGRVHVTVRTESDMRRDVIVAERGGWLKAGHGLNQLTYDRSSIVGEGAPYYEAMVSITPRVAPSNTE